MAFPRRWTRTQGVPEQAYASWRTTLAETPGRQARILAWAPTRDGGVVIASPAVLSIGSGEDWRHVGWHQIERGGWNGETEQLQWRAYDGSRGTAALPDPGRIPEVFKERVEASIVFERFLPISAGTDRGVVVNGRRDLADVPTVITWHATLTRGVTWRTPGVSELADAALVELRDEYDER